VKRAAPDASILMAAPLDRAEKGDDGRLRSKKVILKLIASQRKAAAEVGVAYWDTWKAMGGEGAMGRWVNANPQLGAGDLTHPTPAGAQVIGEHLDRALAQGLAVWRARPPAPH
jgi:lysophospholipase L1-like esterase